MCLLMRLQIRLDPKHYAQEICPALAREDCSGTNQDGERRAFHVFLTFVRFRLFRNPAALGVRRRTSAACRAVALRRRV